MLRMYAVPALAVLLLLPKGAAAQPVVYVCNPLAQVVKVDTTPLPDLPATVEVIYNGFGSFNDCVFGPDAKLYVSQSATSSSHQVIRFDPGTPPASGQAEIVATLPALRAASAFNVTTLYVSTASSGLFSFAGMSVAAQGGPYPTGTAIALIPPSSAAKRSGNHLLDRRTAVVRVRSDDTRQRASAGPPPPLCLVPTTLRFEPAIRL